MKNILFCISFLPLICFSQQKRDEFKVNIAFDSINNYTATIPASPYFVKEKILQIYPGEEINVEAEVSGDSITSMKVVKTVGHPDRTINIHFYQDASDRKKAEMMLYVKNPFNKRLQYDAAIYIPGSKGWSETSILPVEAGLIGIEMWPDAIASIVLEKWRFVTK